MFSEMAQWGKALATKDIHGTRRGIPSFSCPLTSKCVHKHIYKHILAYMDLYCFSKRTEYN